MKHAGKRTLDALESLLACVRRLQGIVERKRGIFYRAGRAFLHFHEDPSGIFADVRPNDAWRRVPVASARERLRLLRLVRSSLQGR